MDNDTHEDIPEKKLVLPDADESESYKILTGCGNMYVHIVRHEDDTLQTLFANLGKAGQCAQAGVEAICRVVHVALANGADVDTIIKALRGVACNRWAHDYSLRWREPVDIGGSRSETEGAAVTSCADGIAAALELSKQEGGEANE